MLNPETFKENWALLGAFAAGEDVEVPDMYYLVAFSSPIPPLLRTFSVVRLEEYEPLPGIFVKDQETGTTARWTIMDAVRRMDLEEVVLESVRTLRSARKRDSCKPGSALAKLLDETLTHWSAEAAKIGQ